MATKPDMMEKWEAELEKGTSLSKCLQCGCMKGALEEMRSCLSSAGDTASAELLKRVAFWLGRMESSLYT
jgi:hypothetical protein